MKPRKVTPANVQRAQWWVCDGIGAALLDGVGGRTVVVVTAPSRRGEARAALEPWHAWRFAFALVRYALRASWINARRRVREAVRRG